MIEPKTKRQIIEDSLQLLSGSSFAQTTRKNSVAGGLLDLLAQYQADLHALLYEGIISGLIDRASGGALDNIGVLLGRARTGASYAEDQSTTNVKLYIDPVLGSTTAGLLNLLPATATDSPISYDKGAGTITIHSGLRLRVPGSFVAYRTTASVTFTSTATEVGVPVVAEAPSAAYSITVGALREHNILEVQPILEPIAKYILCTNSYDISNGADTENDENYRYFLANQVQSAQAANEIAIRVAALSVPGVSDIILRRWTYGIGTFSLYVVGTTPIASQGLLNTVKQAVTQVIAYPERFTVTGPDYIGIKLVVGLITNPTSTTAVADGLKNQAQQAIIDYINNIPLGGSLVINEIIQRVMDISEDIIDMTITNMNVGRYNPKLNRIEFQQPVIVKNQVAGTHQKFFTTYNYCTVC